MKKNYAAPRLLVLGAHSAFVRQNGANNTIDNYFFVDVRKFAEFGTDPTENLGLDS